MLNRKMWVIVVSICLLAFSSTAALLYFWSDFPRKTPIRAKQVFLMANGLYCSSSLTVTYIS